MTTGIRKVNCFGGSSTYGYCDREHYIGWVGRLKQDFHEANDNGDVEYKDLAAFYNLSILGNTALKLCDQVARERAIRARRGYMMLNIFSIGTNDSAIRSDGSPVTKESDYVDHLEVISDALRDDEATVLYVGLTSIDDSRTVNFRNRGVTYQRKRIKRYEELALEVCQERGIETVPLFDESDNDIFRATMLDVDSLHPNSEGHKWIYEKVKPKASNLWD